MRHSSWTLFLVPLALPLVLLCIPGALKPVSQAIPTTGVVQESVLDEAPLPPTVPAARSGAGEVGSGERSGAFFKD